jgi:hypothetical protein
MSLSPAAVEATLARRATRSPAPIPRRRVRGRDPHASSPEKSGGSRGWVSPRETESSYTRSSESPDTLHYAAQTGHNRAAGATRRNSPRLVASRYPLARPAPAGAEAEPSRTPTPARSTTRAGPSDREGEKDVEAVEWAGVTATATPEALGRGVLNIRRRCGGRRRQTGLIMATTLIPSTSGSGSSFPTCSRARGEPLPFRGRDVDLCPTCSEDFGSVSAFDAHRVGKYLQRGPSEYSGSFADWQPGKGRRCLTSDRTRRSRAADSGAAHGATAAGARRINAGGLA